MSVKIHLQDALKRYTLDQDKIIPPEETVRRFKQSLQRLDLDILKQTVRIDNGRLKIPVFFSYCGRDATRIIGTQKQMGKGATPEQAEASAVMELAERFSFFSFVHDHNNFFTDRYVNVKDKALPFEMIARSVHDESPDLEAAGEVFKNLPLKWTWAYNLTLEQEVLIPFDWFFTINEFNGPCAGNCVEEALSQGICEIVERHTSSIVSQGRVQVPAIDPDSASDPAVVEMIQKYRNAGIHLFLNDFSLDLGIPSVGVLAYDPSTFPLKSELVWTAGTTPDPQKALSRALTETAQLGGDFNSGSNYVASGLPKLRSMKEAEFVTRAAKTVGIQSLPDLSNENIRIEVENLISTLKARDMEVLAVNTAHPLLGIPAFYTIVPGAHFRERALGTSVGMFSAKLIYENAPASEALEKLAGVEKTLPGKYYVSFYSGACHLNRGDPESSLVEFKKALERKPTTQDIASIYSYMGIAYKNMERFDEALKALEEGERFDDERTDIYNLMGFCHFKLKNHEKAIHCFEKVIALDPTSAIDYANLASNYRELGKTDEAVRYYVMALELDPTLSFARENLEMLQNS